MAATDQLSHGSAESAQSTMPRLGPVFESSSVQVVQIPAVPYLVHFSCPYDALSITTARVFGSRRYDSDKLHPVDVRPFSAAFHPSGSSVFVEARESQGELLAVHMDPAFREQFAEDTNRADLSTESGSADNIQFQGAHELVRTLQQCFASGFVGGKLQIESLGLFALTSVLSSLSSRGHEDPSHTSLGKARLDRVLDLIEENLDGAVGLTDLAGFVDLTPYHFARSFKSATGVSPHQYVMDRRVSRAREMLVGSETSLVDIAYAVGFSSQAHMTDVFRRKLGVTPGKYRAKVAT